MDRTVYCADCKRELAPAHLSLDGGQLPCPDCGSIKQDVKMRFQENMNAEIHDSLKLKAKKNGTKKPLQEIFSGDDQRKSKGDWVYKHRLIDRENDRYTETVKDKETGEIIHHSDEPLTEHWGHGSAKGQRLPDEGDKDT